MLKLKISTKIVALSIINSLIVAIINVCASLTMRNNMMGQPQASSGTAATTANAAAASTATSAVSQAAAAANASATNTNAVQNMLNTQHGIFSSLPPTSVMIGLLISMVIGVVLSYILGKKIAKPIKNVTEVTKKTADFNLEDDYLTRDLTKSKDESSEMADALIATRTALKNMAVRLGKMSGSIDSHSNKLNKVTGESVQSITQVITTISEVAEGNSSQAQTISDINFTLSEVAKLIADITNTTLTGSDSASDSLNTINDGQRAVEVQAAKMKENLEVTKETSKSIEELKEMMEKVGDTIKIITSIADQTNLLALNAAIEAARAGEAGKGFSVVADEIRKLAEESSKASKIIIDLTGKTMEKTAKVVENISAANILVDEQKQALTITEEAFGKIRDSYMDIVNNFKNTAEQMKNVNEKSKQIAEQTQDMAATAQESAASMQEISASGQEQLTSLESISQAAKELFGLAENLNKEVAIFKV